MKKLLVVASVALGACAPTIWDKPGASQADFNRDSYACQRDAISLGGVAYGYGVVQRHPDLGVYRMCMTAAGYSRRE